MAVSNFLFGGNQPTTQTTSGSSATNLPTWYNDYSQGLVQRANAIASQPYMAYGGARVASPSALQQASWQQAPQISDQFGANMNNAMGATTNALGQTNPYNTVNTANTFMNPYQNSMIENMRFQSDQDLKNNVLPQITSNYIGGGQFGSSRMGRSLGRAYGNYQNNLNNQIGNLLGQNWNNALGQANTNTGLQLTGANQLGTQAQQGLTGGLQGIGAMNAAGQEQNAYNQKNLDLAYQDYQNQLNYPKTQLGFLQSILQGTQLPTSTNNTSTGAVQLPQQSPLSQIAGMASAGAALGKLFE